MISSASVVLAFSALNDSGQIERLKAPEQIPVFRVFENVLEEDWILGESLRRQLDAVRNVESLR